jgi:hypothetical protein
LWRKVRDLHEPHELKVFIHSEGFELEAEKVVGIDQDYDCKINYHPGKANVDADALSKKSKIELATIGISQPQLIMELKRLKLEVVGKGTPALLSSMVIQPKLLKMIKIAQIDDPEC